MKRSEMLQLISQTFDEVVGDAIPNSSAMNIPDFTNYFLTKLESAGIQPPGIKEPCTTFVLHNGQYLQTEDSFIFTNRWDDEA